MKNNTEQYSRNPEGNSASLKNPPVNFISEKDEEIKQLREELLSTRRYLNDFVYAAAHALKSPVANLNLITILLEKTNDIEEIKSYLQTIKCSIKRLDQTIHGMVQGFQVKTIEGYPELIPLASFIDAILMKIKGNTNCRSAKVVGDYECCPEILYDKNILSDILSILIQNAFYYNADHDDLQIKIKSEKFGEAVLIEITDNGIGIDLEKHSNDLFQPFKKLSANSSGNGMGLYLAKTLIELNNGKIEIESKLNIGTTVKCYLKEGVK